MPSKGIRPVARSMAFAAIAFMVVRSLVYQISPDFLPSSAWRPETWTKGILIGAGFDLMMLAVLIGVPVCIYLWRSRYRNVREFLADCAAAGSLYLTALFLF